LEGEGGNGNGEVADKVTITGVEIDDELECEEAD